MEVDLCFVIDCTGSMSSHITSTKECIGRVVDHFMSKEAIKLRLGFCGYRDHCDGTNRIEKFDFDYSVDKFRDFVSKVSATGGGDSPEDVLGGLNEAVTNMIWRNNVRVLLHVCDYPPHGRRFNNTDDDYPNGDPNGLTEESVLEKMRSANIKYFFGKITSQTDTMIRIFREIIGEFNVFDLENTAKANELIEKFLDATCKAIYTAISLMED